MITELVQFAAFGRSEYVGGEGGAIGPQALSVLAKALLATGVIVLIGHFLLPHRNALRLQFDALRDL